MQPSLNTPLHLLTKIAQCSKEYYALVQDGPQQMHFAEFLESLSEGLKSYFQEKGFEASRQNIMFRRFVLERAGLQMDAFLRERLDLNAYKIWQEQDAYQVELLLRIKQTA